MEINIFSSGTQPSVKRGVLLFATLVAVNVVLWVALLALSWETPLLLGLFALAWGLGLRHAMDADHIAAIDNATRRLLYRGRPSVGVGFFFSLGHSTVVLCFTAAIVFAVSSALTDIAAFRETGALIGGTVSSLFLLGIGTANLFVLRQLFRALKDVRAGKENTYHGHLHLGGPIEKLFRPLVALVDRSPKMYWIGLLFGLGFDTATEVGLLALSALAEESIDTWMIFLLPLTFAAGIFKTRLLVFPNY